MANVTITQLPAAGPITGTEAVPIVQNGQTVQTTTAAIAASPSQTQTFLTINQEPTLPNSRYMAFGTGLGSQDNGAQSYFRINLTGASLSLENALTGIIAKTGGTTVAPRTLTASGLGLSITNGSGVSGNPTFALDGLPASLAGLSGTAMLAVVSGSSINTRTLTGTANEIAIIDGNGAGNPTFRIASNPVIPGVAGMVVPVGTAAQEPVGTDGQLRFNSDTQTFDGYSAGQWRSFTSSGGVLTFSGGLTGLLPASPTSGVVTLSGVLNAVSGGTGQSSYTTGDVLYATTSTSLGKLTLGTSGDVLTAGASAPQYVAQSTLSVGAATNATNIAVTLDSTNVTNYLAFVNGTSGNKAALVNSSITCNPSTGKITGGVAGGSF